MSEQRTCETCRAWHSDVQEDQGQSGDCRRSPPTIVPEMIPRPYNPEEPWLAVHEATFFPRTWAHEWCGSHELPEQAVQSS